MFLKDKFKKGNGSGTIDSSGEVTVTHNLGNRRGFDIEARINYGGGWEETTPIVNFFEDYFVLNFGSGEVVGGSQYEYYWSIYL